MQVESVVAAVSRKLLVPGSFRTDVSYNAILCMEQLPTKFLSLQEVPKDHVKLLSLDTPESKMETECNEAFMNYLQSRTHGKDRAGNYCNIPHL